MDTMVPYHFFIIWMLSLLSAATHLSTLLALVNDFKRDWVLRWLRQFLMFVNLVLSTVFGIFVLEATMKSLDPTLAVACVWEVDGKGAPSNAALSVTGTIAVIVVNAMVFFLGVWYLHSKGKRWIKVAQALGWLALIAIAVGATVRVVTLSQAFGNPSPTVLTGPSEADWSFGQLLPLLLLLLPLLSAIEIIRGKFMLLYSLHICSDLQYDSVKTDLRQVRWVCLLLFRTTQVIVSHYLVAARESKSRNCSSRIHFGETRPQSAKAELSAALKTLQHAHASARS